MQLIWIMGVTVAGKPAATEITSSPGFNLRSPSFSDVNAEKAIRFAEYPELTRITSDIPRKSEIFSANSSEHLHSVSQKSREESTRLTSSFSSKTLPA